MNERIRELVEQAGMTLQPRRRYSEDYPAEMLESDNDYFDNNLEAVRAFFDGGLEKFAELLVRECIDVLQKDLPDADQVVTRNEVILRACNVAEHFGVEE